MTKDQEDRLRAIVREEVALALGALAREAEYQHTYDSDVIEATALSVLRRCAEGAADRITCPHAETDTWSRTPRCRRCGEPQILPKNPFEENHDQG